MGILDKVVKIEKRIEKLASRKDAVVTPIEIRQAILDDIEGHVQPAGRGRRVFPYDEIAIEVLSSGGRKAPGTTRTGTLPAPGRAELEAVLDPEQGLTDAIGERLREAGCDRVGRLHVSVKVVSKRRAEWQPGVLFHVSDARGDAASAPSRLRTPALPPEGVEARRASSRPVVPAEARKARAPHEEGQEAPGTRHAQLSVVEGEATRKAYALTGERTNIGRLAEVTDKHRRIVRRNQIVFLDVDTEANQTVSRAQAHIRFTPPDEYRLYDDHSSYGTRIARDGRMIELPSGSPRGVKLQSGDEIYFGRARVVFQLK